MMVSSNPRIPTKKNWSLTTPGSSAQGFQGIVVVVLWSMLTVKITKAWFTKISMVATKIRLWSHFFLIWHKNRAWDVRATQVGRIVHVMACDNSGPHRVHTVGVLLPNISWQLLSFLAPQMPPVNFKGGHFYPILASPSKSFYQICQVYGRCIYTFKPPSYSHFWAFMQSNISYIWSIWDQNTLPPTPPAHTKRTPPGTKKTDFL